jgi:hypothetical protein
MKQPQAFQVGLFDVSRARRDDPRSAVPAMTGRGLASRGWRMFSDRLPVASQLVQVPDLFLGLPAAVQTLHLRLYRLLIT